ncbi:unnamed protein product [Thelazia callipaeda]|uniref:HECT-type E3 ubiquitin transferase n=1 Tax=Thelazia callipaeda TaxID=103827 RepID=A0A0N5CZ64_THECL|nr:unnamed protein product [Thelazia callipaeda]
MVKLFSRNLKFLLHPPSSSFYFWTSDLAHQENKLQAVEGHLSSESSDVKFFCKKRLSLLSKHYVSTNGADTHLLKSVDEKHVNNSSSLAQDKDMVQERTCSTRTTSSQGSSATANDAGEKTSASVSRSLLRHTFRAENSSTSAAVKHTDSNKIIADREGEVAGLAQCRIFTPLDQRRITSSQSAFALSSTSSLSTQGVHQDSMHSDISVANCSFSKRNRFTEHLNQQFPAPLLRTFKPGRSIIDIVDQEKMQKLTSANYCLPANSKPVVKPKPLGLRRERSDLTDVYGSHIVAHYSEHGTSADITNGNNDGNSIRRALVPPSACLDENVLRKCLEELKRKRQDGMALTSEEGSGAHQQFSQRNHRREANESDLGSVNIVLRARSGESYRTDQRRLSVPDLVDLQHLSSNSVGSGVTATAKALTSKFGRNPGTGELQTINEGLVSPLVRCKQYVKDVQKNDVANDWCSAGFSQKPSPPHKKLPKQAEQKSVRNDNLRSVEQMFSRKLVTLSSSF